MHTSSGANLRVKSYLAAGFALLALASVQIAANPVADTYEISIYDAYLPGFWLAIVGAILVGQVLILGAVIRDFDYRWKFGAGLILLADCLLLALPYLRYPLYALGKADMLTFLGTIRYITETGHFQPSNYYPGLHVFATSFSTFTDLTPEQTVNALPPLFSLFYICGTYLFLRETLPKKQQVLIALPVFSLPLFAFENLMFSPSVTAFSLVPLVLYLYLRSRLSTGVRFNALILVILFAFVFFHPIVTIFLGLLLVLVDVSIRLDPRSIVESQFVSDRGSTNLVLLLGTLFFTWYYSFESIIGSTILILFRPDQEPEAAQVTSVLDRASPAVADIIQVGWYSYGIFGIIALIGGLALCYILLHRLYTRRLPMYHEWFFGSVFVLFVVLSVVAFLLDLTIGSPRVYRYALLSGVGLIGIALFRLYNRLDGSTYVTAIVVGLFVMAFLFAFVSVFMLYPSPLSHDYNAQITENEQESMTWLFEHREESLLIDELGTKQSRFYQAQNGGVGGGENIRHPDDTDPPDHFGYNESESLGVYYDQPRYLVITELGRMQAPVMYPDYEEYWRYTPEDFRRLRGDPANQRIYDSGEVTTYYVESG